MANPDDAQQPESAPEPGTAQPQVSHAAQSDGAPEPSFDIGTLVPGAQEVQLRHEDLPAPPVSFEVGHTVRGGQVLLEKGFGLPGPAPPHVDVEVDDNNEAE